MLKTEEWRLIPGYPDYAVSEYGKVKRVTKAQGAQAGKIRKPVKNGKYDYYALTLSGKMTSIFGHRLVALAFIGPPPTPKHEVAHKNWKHKDNHYSNLRWATHKENMDDRVKHKNVNQHNIPGYVISEETKKKQGKGMRGKHHTAKFKKDHSDYMKKAWAAGKYNRQITT